MSTPKRVPRFFASRQELGCALHENIECQRTHFSKENRHHWRFLLSDLDEWMMKKQGNFRADRAFEG
jgi:hypothetical protein